MKSKSLQGKLRKNIGKKETFSLRKENRIPCVIYGGKENIHFSIKTVEFDKIINSPEVCFVDLELDNSKKFRAIIQDIQSHPVTDAIIHADFIEVVKGKKVTIDLPVKTKGSSNGVIQGGKLRMVTRKIKVKGLEENIIDYIECDITNLDIGDAIKVKDINLNGLEILNSEDTVVLAVKMSRAAISSSSEDEEADDSEETEQEEPKKEEQPA